MIFPGSCTARGARHRARPADSPWPRPVTRSRLGQQQYRRPGTPSPCRQRTLRSWARGGILHLESAFGLGADMTSRQALFFQVKAMPVS